ncbi:MAG: GntR family transcriptional regulator [Phototrophicaceae bacterium]
MMSEPNAQEKAVDRAHRLLIERILDGTYPIGFELPGERILSKDLGLARNILREALQRLSQNGWLEISQGRATRVRDYQREGNINILIDLMAVNPSQRLDFVPQLLRMWALLATDYTAAAVRREPGQIIDRLRLYDALSDSPEACTQATWQLHRALIDYSGNVVYGLIFNSFADFYQRLALHYYTDPIKRQQARAFWRVLTEAARQLDAVRAAQLVHAEILADTDYWRRALPAELPPASVDTSPFDSTGDNPHER